MFLRSCAMAALVLGALGSVAAASPSKDLDAAASHGEVAFIIVTDRGAAGVDEAKAMVGQARQQVQKSVLVELDRSDPVNADLVAKFRLAGAPVPLVLVAAANGVLAGGLQASQATADKLVAMIPSPKKTEILQALQSGKAVFISVSRKGMAAQSGVTSICEMACGQMQNKSVTVRIDMDDPAEAGFLTQLNVNRASTQPITLVINAQGQITGSYTGTADVASLVQAANKKGGGCAPGACGPGSAKSCAPAK